MPSRCLKAPKLSTPTIHVRLTSSDAALRTSLPGPRRGRGRFKEHVTEAPPLSPCPRITRSFITLESKPYLHPSFPNMSEFPPNTPMKQFIWSRWHATWSCLMLLQLMPSTTLILSLRSLAPWFLLLSLDLWTSVESPSWLCIWFRERAVYLYKPRRSIPLQLGWTWFSQGHCQEQSCRHPLIT